MASEHPIERQAAERSKVPAEVRIPVRPAAPSGPPLLQDGLEVLRSSHC